MVVGNGINPKPPLILELVGPAGAGKTTLSRVLSQREEKILIGPDIELRKVRHIPSFIRSIPSFMPLLLHRHRPNRRSTWTELKDIAYLNAWPNILRRAASNQGKVILLDQGPVFRLATLREFGPETLKREAFEAWWLQLYKQWASTLDMVIWLDTSDAVLVERINTRKKKHDIKGKPDIQAQYFLTQYRSSYRDVLTKLTLYNGPTLLQFDTSKVSVEQIADDILTACKLRRSEN